MGRRYGLTVGGLFGGFFVAALLGGVRTAASDGAADESRLLVATNAQTRARVLEALRPLGVRVYDLSTMQLVSGEAGAPPPAASPLPIVDARPAWTALTRALDTARAATDLGAIELRTVSVKGLVASAQLRATDGPAVDALVKALAEQPGIVPGARKEWDAAGHVEATVEFRVGAAQRLEAEPLPWEIEGLQAFRTAAVRAHAMIVSIGAVQTAEGTGWSRVDVRLRFPADERVALLLDEISGVKNLHVVALGWASIARERVVDLTLTLALRPKR